MDIVHKGSFTTRRLAGSVSDMKIITNVFLVEVTLRHTIISLSRRYRHKIPFLRIISNF